MMTEVFYLFFSFVNVGSFHVISDMILLDFFFTPYPLLFTLDHIYHVWVDRGAEEVLYRRTFAHRTRGGR